MNFNLTNTRKRLTRLYQQSKPKANEDHEPDYAQGYRAGLRDAVEALRLEVGEDETLLRKRYADEKGAREWNEYIARTGGR